MNNYYLLQSATGWYYKVRQLSLFQSAARWYYKLRQLFYYKVRPALLQSATGITKCDKCYYKVRQVLQSATLLQSVTVHRYNKIVIIVHIQAVALA